jgi:hypothetical protein
MNKKYIVGISLLVLLFVAAMAMLYYSGTHLKNMQINKAALTSDEEAVFDLTKTNSGGQMFEFRVDPDKVKVLTVSQEELTAAGKWETVSSTYMKITPKNSYSRIYVYLDPESGSWVSMGGIGHMVATGDQTSREKEFEKYVCFTDFLTKATTIVPDRHQILMMKSYNLEGEFSGDNIYEYYHTKTLLKENIKTVVVTATFGSRLLKGM